MKKLIIKTLAVVALAYVILVLANAGAIYAVKGKFDIIMSMRQIGWVPYIAMPIIFIGYKFYKAKRDAKAHHEESTKQ